MDSADSFEVLTQKPNRILNRNENNYSLQKTHDLYYQIQLQINVVELKYCDLIIWSPKPNLDNLIIRVAADMDFWRENMKRAHYYHEQVMMPEILGKCFTKRATVQLTDEDGFVSGEDGDPPGENSDVFSYEISCSSHHKSEKDKGISPTNESKPNENLSDSQSHDSLAKMDHFDHINVRNLKNESIEDILITFFEHEDHLKRLYDQHIKQPKRHYRKDIPDMIALDIVNEQQFQVMINFVETKLVRNPDEENDSSDIIFDSIISEWTLAAFCKKFNFTRSDAVTHSTGNKGT